MLPLFMDFWNTLKSVKTMISLSFFLMNVTRVEERLFYFFDRINDIKKSLKESKEFQKLLEIEIEPGYRTFNDELKLATFGLASAERFEKLEAEKEQR